MCTVAVAGSIVEVLDEKIKNGGVFTAFDITKAARKSTTDNVSHRDVKDIVMNEFDTGQMSGYSRELLELAAVVGEPMALIYYPAGKSASDHPLVSGGSVSSGDGTGAPSGVSVDTGVVSTDPDVFKLTGENRVNIPKSMIGKIIPTGGSYDIKVNGTLKCVSLNSDGRIRLNVRPLGIVEDKVRVTVDAVKNVIEITGVI